MPYEYEENEETEETEETSDFQTYEDLKDATAETLGLDTEFNFWAVHHIL